jgi:anti-sigma regulatory factor (Ser/Thr protein kinase)
MRDKQFKVSLTNRSAALEKLQEFVEKTGLELRLQKDLVLKINLALEEVVSNIINYAYDDEDEHKINIRVERDNSKLMIIIEDDGKAFNILKYPEPDIEIPAEKRNIGGLGIHFVRTLMDSVEYEYRDNKNILLLVKDLE